MLLHILSRLTPSSLGSCVPLANVLSIFLCHYLLFDLSNFIDMLQRHTTDDILARLICSLLYSCCLHEKPAGRGCFQLECERSIGLYSDDTGNRDAGDIVRSSCVEFFSKVNSFNSFNLSDFGGFLSSVALRTF